MLFENLTGIFHSFKNSSLWPILKRHIKAIIEPTLKIVLFRSPIVRKCVFLHYIIKINRNKNSNSKILLTSSLIPSCMTITHEIFLRRIPWFSSRPVSSDRVHGSHSPILHSTASARELMSLADEWIADGKKEGGARCRSKGGERGDRPLPKEKWYIFLTT